MVCAISACSHGPSRKAIHINSMTNGSVVQSAAEPGGQERQQRQPHLVRCFKKFDACGRSLQKQQTNSTLHEVPEPSRAYLMCGFGININQINLNDLNVVMFFPRFPQGVLSSGARDCRHVPHPKKQQVPT